MGFNSGFKGLNNLYGITVLGEKKTLRTYMYGRQEYFHSLATLPGM
jgi:hypothetical protein